MDERGLTPVEAETKPAATTKKHTQADWVVGCIFIVPVVFIAVALSLVTVWIAVDTLMDTFRDAHGPIPNQSTGIILVTFAILVPLAFFFDTVACRLLASFRGKPVPYLFPPIVGVVLGGLLGIGGIMTVVAWLLRWGHGRVTPAPIAIAWLFLVYAGHQGRKLLRLRRIRHEQRRAGIAHDHRGI